ncbi:GNAT family N-acetyltransferase [Planctomonas deserti]|uniref:GNAT family N-acetyltransferase n=1 Tax=Planctomonas deserti TaxID=2144185 RepID=UPI00197B9F64|nr:GNAT family N-acetyltransferase [Planctomonas deserti]
MTTAPRIHRATPDEAPEVARLAELTFALACPPGTAPTAIERFIADNLTEVHFRRYLADENRQVILATDDGRPVGYTMLVHGEPADDDVAVAISLRPSVELSKVYVLQTHHGVGVAGALMDATLDAAREGGAVGVWLGVNKHNERAIRFYRKSGFEVVGSKTFLVGPELHHDHVLEREL